MMPGIERRRNKILSGELLFLKFKEVENKTEKLKSGAGGRRKQRGLLGFHMAPEPGRRKTRKVL